MNSFLFNARRSFVIFPLLLAGLSINTFGAEASWKTVTWTTKDGVTLVGLYQPASHAKAYTWVLLHGLGSTKEEWRSFGAQLVKQGSGVLLYDLRGHNESIHGPGGETLDYKAWQTAGTGTAWDAMPADLSSAVEMLQKEYSIPVNKIAVGGASLGANIALAYAGAHPAVPALILLSPGMEYAGIPSDSAYKAYSGRPVFIAASPGDLYAYSSVRQLTDRVKSSAQTVAWGKEGHGVQMFKDDVFTKGLADWARRTEKPVIGE